MLVRSAVSVHMKVVRGGSCLVWGCSRLLLLLGPLRRWLDAQDDGLREGGFKWAGREWPPWLQSWALSIRPLCSQESGPVGTCPELQTVQRRESTWSWLKTQSSELRRTFSPQGVFVPGPRVAGLTQELSVQRFQHKSPPCPSGGNSVSPLPAQQSFPCMTPTAVLGVPSVFLTPRRNVARSQAVSPHQSLCALSPGGYSCWGAVLDREKSKTGPFIWALISTPVKLRPWN